MDILVLQYCNVMPAEFQNHCYNSATHGQYVLVSVEVTVFIVMAERLRPAQEHFNGQVVS
jgi:hypothetical protein